MSSVLAFVLNASALLAPDRNHETLGGAIARAVDGGAPLFADDADKRRTAAYLVAIAFRESSLRADAVGDCDGGSCAKGGSPRSFCAFQIHASSGGTKALLTDPDACVATALAMLRTSMRVCSAHPLAWYAEGPRGCSSPRAQRISRDRLALARRLVREVQS